MQKRATDDGLGKEAVGAHSATLISYQRPVCGTMVDVEGEEVSRRSRSTLHPAVIDAVRVEVVRCRKAGVRFNAHKVANELAAKHIKVSVSSVRSVRAKIDSELGPMSAEEWRLLTSPQSRRSVQRRPTPGRASLPKAEIVAIEKPAGHYGLLDYSPGDTTPFPHQEIVLSRMDYRSLCDAFMVEYDDEDGRQIDLSYLLEEADGTGDGSDVLCLGYPYGHDAAFPIDRGDFVLQVTALLTERAKDEGQMSNYDPDAPLDPLEIWYEVMGPGHDDPVIQWRYWPNIKLDLATRHGH